VAIPNCSVTPNKDGTLVNDVKVGAYHRPWDARYDARKLAPGIPKASLWAPVPSGIDQVGCVYTAQGFDFDYAGVIFAKDMIIRDGKWVGQPHESHDGQIKRNGPVAFADCARNAYRILLTRGLKGCYVCFLDNETGEFFKSHLLVKDSLPETLGET